MFAPFSWRSSWIFGLLALALAVPAVAGDELRSAFSDPPDATKPRCYWYWIDGHISREGITHDLQAMKRVGIGEGYIGIIGGGDVKALTEPWWGLLEHAIREGTRLGVDVGVFNCPGWSQSGGPWITPGQSMRYIARSETRMTGPDHFQGKLPAPAAQCQDIRVLAFPAPQGDAGGIEMISAQPNGDNRSQIKCVTDQPFTARSLTLVPAGKMNAAAELLASDDGRTFRSVRKFTVDRHNVAVNVGPVPLAPVVISFPATTARFFRLTFSGPYHLRSALLSGAARVESCMEKQLAKVFQDPQPPFDFYSWPLAAEPEKPELIVKIDTIRDLTKQMDADGTLRWNVPAGEWVVVRFAAAPTGVTNAPAPPEATGMEVDKLSRAPLRAHFDAYIGKLLNRIPAAERGAFRHVVADSYETGPQNWTDDFLGDFKQRYGYDALPFFPALTGRIVGSADQSDRFLWDVRRMIADRVASEYVGGLRDLCHEHGLKMWLENYGHWGFPAEFLQYGGSCDEISGEFWADGNLGSVELRDAASAAHTYGKPVVFAEAFTGGPAFRSTPASLKARGDWALCEGINQFVLHVYIHQPWDDRHPGVNAWFGTEFNRNNTWFEYAKPWIDYQRRCSVLLQAGKPVADVAYFIGEDAPKMAGQRRPELPAGYDFDYINADVILNRMQVKDGRLVLPDGVSYRLLVLPESPTMRPALLKKIRELVAAGGAVLGSAPVRSPSMQDYPACDQQVKQLAAELWGQRKIMQHDDLRKAMDELHTPADVICPDGILWKHRRDAGANTDIYFLCNQKPFARTETIGLRVDGRAPELWWPETGCIERPAVYDIVNGVARVPVHFGPNTSVFVVFREPANADRVVQAARDGQPLFDMTPRAAGASGAAVGSFTMAIWARPDADTALPREANAGASGLADHRNEVFAPLHGNTFDAAGGHAGAGLAIGRNGVVVYEHGANYFAPVLVHAAPIADWTHVAVVYRDNQPALFLNGVAVHTGLKSSHVVHSSVTTAGGSQGFVGRLGSSESLPAALAADDLLKLMARMPKSLANDNEPPIALCRDDAGQIVARVRQPGVYTWTTAAGATRKLEIASAPAPVELVGPWNVTFDPKNGGPAAPVTFDKLDDWTKRPEDGIRHYSGVAVYRQSFDLSDAGSPLWLDLGNVQSIARVRVNGQDLGIVWKRPYRVDISPAAKAGANTLEIEVVNTWLNRLLGDDAQSDPARRITFAATKSWKSPAIPAGLIGPVTLRREVETK